MVDWNEQMLKDLKEIKTLRWSAFFGDVKKMEDIAYLYSFLCENVYDKSVQVENADKMFELWYKRTIKWYKRAIRKGSNKAKARLAAFYMKKYKPIDSLPKKEILKLLIAGAKANDLECMYELGLSYLKGELMKPNTKEAFFWLNKVVYDTEEGGRKYSHLVGALFEKAELVPYNKEQALEYYERGADLGEIGCLLTLIKEYHEKYFYIIDEEKAESYYMDYSERKNAVKELSKDKIIKGIKYLEICNRENLFFEMTYSLLGCAYCKGNGVGKDFVKGFSYLNKVYQSQYFSNSKYAPLVYYCLAQCYMEGNGTGADYNQARRIYLQALQLMERYIESETKRNFEARIAVKLGDMAYQGLGQGQDFVEAVSYYHRASEMNGEAAYKLGQCYFNGIGVKQDKDMAIECYKKAAKMDNKDAKNILYAMGYKVEEII